MADYTPDTPYILGMEWVPIKESPYLLDSSQEIGTSFQMDLPTTVVSGRTYGVETDAIPTSGWLMNVYRQADFDQAGPVQSTVIQCEAVSAVDSGADATFQDQDGNTDNASLAAALGSCYDGKYVLFNAIPGGNGQLSMYFDVGSHTELTGKRILGVEFLYRVASVDGNDDGIDSFLEASLSQLYTKVDSSILYLLMATDSQFFTSDTDFTGHPIKSIDMGNANFFWNADTSGNISDWPNPLRDLYPWTPLQLGRFDSSTASNRLSIVLDVEAVAGDGAGCAYFLQYAALRVTYCEEKRVLIGGSSANWAVGVNPTQLRNPALSTVGAALPAGQYVVTVSRANIGTYRSPFTFTGIGNPGDMYTNALIETYPMEKQVGKLMVYTSTEGDTPDTSDTSQLVQLSLHTASAAVTGVHPYGTQVAAPVWGGGSGTYARQEVVSSSGASLGRYPYARFYARRTPETTQALTLRHSTYTSAITASITVDAFDELDEIADGWKEVTLTFSSPTPSFGNSGSLETYEWISADTVGGQWQVMGAAAPAVTGNVPRVQITGSQALDVATYGGPQGANLTWNGTNDVTADATLLFAQEMPAVSGLAIGTSSLEVTGIGLNCDLLSPDCIPTGISYHSLTWTQLQPASIPASGFGYYELQRSDDYGTWETILQASSPLVTGYHDYEARVGVQSDYRIRFVHRLDFPSAWSSTVSSTLTAPGITGADVSNGILIFTTNEVQDGSRSLAYAMQWESDVAEGFTFLEAAEAQLQKMYGRDFQIAFRPLERGGSRFQRTMLVQAAAVPTGLIQDGFTSLRDLAWEDVSYICVRDELGDRWLATVLVPEGNVQRNRTLYMANIDITEVTDTPSIVALPDSCTAANWDQLPGWDYGCWT